MSALQITQARVSSGYLLQLEFNDGRSGSLDFSALLVADLPEVFGPLKDMSTFQAFELRNGTLRWPSDLDLAPEYLYFRTFANEPSLRERFVTWGYLPPVAT